MEKHMHFQFAPYIEKYFHKKVYEFSYIFKIDEDVVRYKFHATAYIHAKMWFHPALPKEACGHDFHYYDAVSFFELDIIIII